MIQSLRFRLFVGLAIVVGVVGALGGAVAYNWAYDEAIESQDTILTQIAAVAARTRFEDDHPVEGGDIESQITIKELGNSPISSDARSSWLLKDGLHDVWADQSRLMMRTRPDGSRFIVTQPISIRDEMARDSATQALLPFAALVPCLMLMVWLVIARSLRPMTDLSDTLDRRRPDDLADVPMAGTPSELHPFILSINRLLTRVESMMDHQRQFITNAAHELRTPVTALSLQAENLEQTELSPEGRSRLARLRDGTRRTAHLLDQLLALARDETADTAKDGDPVSLHGCATQVVADLLPIATDRGVDLGFDVIEAVTIQGNVLMMSTVIRNLVDNAVRATLSGGQVDVSIFQENSVAVLQVTDTGPGIASEDLARIFDPFFRGSRPLREGTGLGLAIVKRIVTRLNGTVELANRKDAATGLRALVRFPLRTPRSSMPAANPKK